MGVSIGVVDGAVGRPAEGVQLSLLRERDAGWEEEGTGNVDDSGGVPQLPSPSARGRYRLVVDLDRYYAALGSEPFVSYADVCFRVFQPAEQVRLLVVVTPSSVYLLRGDQTQRGALLPGRRPGGGAVRAI